MIQKTPLLIICAIFLGLLSFHVYATIFFCELKQYDETDDKGGNLEIIVEVQKDRWKVKQDTIKLKNKIENVSFANTTNELSKRNSLVLNLTPKTLIYIVFHSMYLSISIVIMLIMIFLNWRMVKEFELNILAKEILWSLLGIAILLIVTMVLIELINTNATRLIGGARIMEWFNIIFENPTKVIGIISNSLTIVALFLLYAIAIINLIGSIVINSESNNENKYKKLKELKSNLNSIAFFGGLILSGVVIGTSLQRQMIAEFLTNISTIYPDEFIAIYGVAFTFILAMFFIPTMLYIKYCEGKTELKEELTREKTSWFKIRKDTIKEMEIVFSIFLPSIVSIIDYFI